MESGIQMTAFNPVPGEGSKDKLFSLEQAEKVWRFHKSLKGYEPTPLRRLEALGEALGISELYVKDESFRFGLNAFKGLGGSYALGRIISRESGNGQRDGLVDGPDQAQGDGPEVLPGTFTFVTATDGNHGRGVAWAAKNLSQKAVVYMPKGSAKERLENIRSLGAQAEITELNYDDTVRFAMEQAEKNGWTLVQDTAWDGYEEIPSYIMQGYMTMAAEAAGQLGDVRPTHIFIQAGVGAMAGAVTGFFNHYYKENKPVIVIVEPDKADCLYRTAQANDGRLHKVEGDLDSIMAGLCCGEVCTIGWEVLKHHANYFFSCPDYIAADGMRVLGNPAGRDARVISGESGAATLGLVYHLMTDPEVDGLRREIGLGADSKVLCFSTEGDTDKVNYRHVVWDGWYGMDGMK